MDLKVTDKVAVVTGAGSGIGLGIAKAFVAEGAKVALMDRNMERGHSIAHNLGPNCNAFIAELTNEEDVKASIQEIIECYGRIDILINNAGVNDSVGLEAGLEDFRSSLEKNLVQVYSMAHYCREQIVKNEGSIVNIGSKTCLTGQGGTSGYAASKGGMNALTREWAVDLAPHGVHVNCVIPAEVWTPLYERWISSQGNPDELKKSIEAKIPLQKRFTTVEEIADMTIFLASPISKHTTGQFIHVDGGYVHLDRSID